MARPRRIEDGVRITIRVPRTVRDGLTKLGAADKRDMSDYARIVLEAHVAKKFKATDPTPSEVAARILNRPLPHSKTAPSRRSERHTDPGQK